ncbi:efflux RND transporter permease subunit [Bathymodiolus septemdierum thioautotrophic gill symbiont]|uniref:Transporter n=1 Tax=endosymbiont of Bathymodiolus septemdierum str. Myojin knoll TaxID=1303921 RepID=A0A0P0UQR2_9GAMM|nr:MMPL family transporter [Bathymodiolus septemdierum thioautotrophic gill symbiont]BAS67180.1 transporter [endosymbiont of Bathymodiolus septemdierum str. Myojin knoll]
MKYFYNFVLKKSGYSIVLLLFVLGFFILQIPNFQLDASSDSLVLEGDNNLRYYENIKKNYGSDDYLIISYQVKDNLLAPEQLEHLARFRKDLKTVDQVKAVTTILDVPLFQSPPLSLTELASKNISIDNGNANLVLALEEFKTSPLYADNLVSKDGKTSAILITLKGNEVFAQRRQKRNTMRIQRANNELSTEELTQLISLEKQVLQDATTQSDLQAKTIAEIRTTIGKYRDKAGLFLGGLPMITTDIISYISSDLVVFSIAVIGLMTLILAFIFKGIRWVLIPIGISITGALTMTGVLAFLGWKVTVISSNFFSLLLVMTLSVTIHLVVRYRELAQNDPDLDYITLIKTTLEQMLKPCLFTTLTTIAAFGSLLISGIRPVIDFGWMMSIGVTIALVLSFIIFPIIMSFLPKAKIQTFNTELGITNSLASFTEKFGNHLLIVLVLFIGISAVGISKLSVENRFIDYFKESTEINQGLTLIDKKLGGTIPLEIVFDDLAEDYWYDEDLRVDIHKIHQYLDSLNETGKVLSIDTLMQILAQANDNTLPNGFFLNIIKNQISGAARTQIIDPYLSEDSGQLRMVIRIRETNTELKRAALIEKIEHFISKDIGFKKDTFHTTGMLVLYNNMLQSLFDSQIKTIAVVFAMIFIMFLFIFKSFTLSLLAIIPNMLPSLFILGIMGLMNIPLDLMTITISAIAIGIGVDNAIHYIHRFQEEFQKDKDYLATMYRSHNSIGLAMFYTSITVTLGFLILALSNFIPSIYFGVFTAIAMISALLANLTLLPKLILMVKPKI